MGPIRQIIFQSDSHGVGFFPGLAKPVVIDPASLDREEAARLQALAEDAHFLDQPPEVGRLAKGAADFQCDILTIDDGSVTHTVRVTLPIADPALKMLFDAVKAQVKARRRQSPPQN